jgi:hypothetical protein
MGRLRITLEVREQRVPIPGWVIVATWPNGDEETLNGLYREQRYAERWIMFHGNAWIQRRERAT